MVMISDDNDVGGDNNDDGDDDDYDNFEDISGGVCFLDKTYVYNIGQLTKFIYA